MNGSAGTSIIDERSAHTQAEGTAACVPADAASCRLAGPSEELAVAMDTARLLRQPAWKTVVDRCGAVIGLALLSPVLLATAALIKIVSPGPALFRQQRTGLAGKSFTILKFRTMPTTVDGRLHRAHVSQLVSQGGTVSKLDREEPLIPLGHMMRALGIDELPQLVNVLRGDMSLVGPRPDVLPLADYEPWQRRRFEVLPGITGLWQVSGKNNTTFDEMMQLDAAYVARRSLALDLKILLKTIPTIFRHLLTRTG